jgi:hypothetical protein
VLLACLPAGDAYAQSIVVSGSGYRGSSHVEAGACKYGNTGLRGTLTTTVAPPTVSGVNMRRRRGERSWARYAVFLVDANNGHRKLQASSWSGWLRVRERVKSTWTGSTAFVADWQGNYRADVVIEWWNATRRVGRRKHRVTSYWWYDQYGTGPYGPVSSCHHLQVEL